MNVDDEMAYEGRDAAGTGIASLNEEMLSLCSIQMGKAMFGIDTAMVWEVLGRTDRLSRRGVAPGGATRSDLRRVPLAPPYVAGVIPYRGEVLTTLSLRSLLGDGLDVSEGCVLVLDDAGTGERFGLLVDGVNGVMTVGKEMREENPSTLDARSRALFDGVYKMPTGLMVRIDAARLSPAKLAESRAFAQCGMSGGTGCAR